MPRFSNIIHYAIMKRLFLPIVVGIISFVFLFGSLQAQTITLVFTGRDAANRYVQLNRVTITNLAKGWEETLYWPDTVLTIQNETGIDESIANGGFNLSQNNPNPFSGTTDVNLTVVDAGEVTLEIADVNGHVVETWCTASLQVGLNQFRITLSSAGTYVMTARQNGKFSSIKMVCNGAGNGNRIDYMGNIVKTMHALSPQPKSHTRGIVTRPFNFGDQMEYVGYATINDEECESQHVTQIISVTSVVLQFAETQLYDGMPCPDIPTLRDIDGNVYNTVKIGNQCWMRENLKTTRYSDSTDIPSGDYDTYSPTDPYRYWPHSFEGNVINDGYLYNWPAVMHGAGSADANPSGVQGICPTGWHVPSDAEWTQLTDYVSGQPQFWCGGNSAYIAKSLAANTLLGWNPTTGNCAVGDNLDANNATGFSAFASGYYGGSGAYLDHLFGAHFWSATLSNENYAWKRYLGNVYSRVYREDKQVGCGMSVRCLLNTETQVVAPTVTTAAVSDITDSSAVCGGEVVSDGGAVVTARGVCWSTLPTPTIADNHTADGSGPGFFTSNLAELTDSTTYYVRAYATNCIGTVYGEEVTFTTLVDTTTDDEPSDDGPGFIPDGPNCGGDCYSSSMNITSFLPNDVIRQVSDILGVRVNIEHSYIGDINISIICPNGNSVCLLPDHNSVNNSADFGIVNTSGSGCDTEDNPAGTGWNYCWSENTLYAQSSGYCYNNANVGNDRSMTVDSSHVAQGFPGQSDFVQGQKYYTPFQSFTNLIGCPLNGQWGIQICDTWSGDNGYVFEWEIVFDPELGNRAPMDVNQHRQGAGVRTDMDGSQDKILPVGN